MGEKETREDLTPKKKIPNYQTAPALKKPITAAQIRKALGITPEQMAAVRKVIEEDETEEDIEPISLPSWFPQPDPTFKFTVS